MEQNIDLVKELGLWKWLVVFIVVTLVPIGVQFIREQIRAQKDKKMFDSLVAVSKVPELLVEIKDLLKCQYTENISEQMCDALIRPVVAHSTKRIAHEVSEVIRNNNLTDARPDIEQRMGSLMENVFIENNDSLSKFRYKGRRLSEFVNGSWKKSIYDIILKSLYDCKGGADRKMKFLYSGVDTEFENMRFNMMKLIQNS